MPAVRVGALISTNVFIPNIKNGSQLLVPAKAAIANIYAWGAGGRGAQREDHRFVKGGGGGAHAGTLGYMVTPGQYIYFSIPYPQTDYSNTVQPTIVLANDNSTVICKAMSPLDQTNNQQGYGAPVDGCIGDYAFKGGNGYINTNNNTHYGGGGGGAGTDGEGGTGQGGEGYTSGIAGLGGPGRTFTDTDTPSVILSPGRGGDTVGGSFSGSPVGGGGAARNPNGNSGGGAAGGVVIEFFELPIGGAQIFVL